MAGERTKQDNAVGTDNSSGVAKAYDFERVNAMLVSKANALDQWERRVSKIVCAYHQVELDHDKEDLIKYPEDFDVRNLADEFDIASNLMVLSFPDEVRREQGMQLLKELFPTASKELQGRINESMKEWPIDPIEMASSMAEASMGARDKDTPSPIADVGALNSKTKDDDNGIRSRSRPRSGH